MQIVEPPTLSTPFPLPLCKGEKDTPLRHRELVMFTTGLSHPSFFSSAIRKTANAHAGLVGNRYSTVSLELFEITGLRLVG